MVSFLRGKVKHRLKNCLILEVNNIGYQVFVTPTFLADVKEDDEISLYTHQYVREDALNLYGFKSLDELRIFEDLISVSGVGPKSALSVLTIAAPTEIEQAIERGDASLLIKVSGIGKKTAQRIVLELKGKLIKDDEVHISSENEEVVEALVGLGYKERVARQVVNKLPEGIESMSEKIREALKIASGG